MNTLSFKDKKLKKEKISVVTCYDYTSAAIVNKSEIDAILVGDSLAMTMHGYPSTLSADTNLMAIHTAAVVRGAPKKFIIGDLPFMSYRKSLTENMNAVEAIMKAGAHAVKLEGIVGNEEFVSHLVQSGVPVMGHLGLTPQFVHQLGGYKVQGKTQESAELIVRAAETLENCGAFSVVLECVPSPLARRITESVSIPTIGIGAGPDTDGQVLVFQDLLGLNSGFSPRFVRRYLNGEDLILGALNNYHAEVQDKEFPGPKESFE